MSDSTQCLAEHSAWLNTVVAQHSVVSREMEDGIKWLGVATCMDRHSVSVDADTNTVTDAI